MGASTDIYGQIHPVQPVNMLAQLAQVAQVQGLQGQNALAQYGLKKAEREDGEVNALNSAYASALGADGKVDRNQLYQRLAQGNLGSRLPAIQKTFADQDNAQTTADQAKFKLATERHDYFKKALGALAQEPNLSKDLVVQAGQSLVQQGILPAEMYQSSIASMPDNPAELRQRLIQGVKAQMTPEQMFTVFAPKAEKMDNGGQISFRDTNPNSPTYGQATGGAPIAKVQSPDSVASNATTMRGQNITDARAREALTEGKTQIVQTDNGPVLVNKSTGTGSAVTGPDGQQLAGVTKPLNDTQAKSLLFGSRMQAADKVLEQLATEGTTTSVPGSRAPFIGGPITALSSDNRQMLDQAKRDFMTAVLRRESGAAISSGEFDTADKQYFPQINDSEKVIAQKAANRQMAIKGVLVEVPEKQRQSLQPAATPAAPTASGKPASGLSAAEQKELADLRARFKK